MSKDNANIYQRKDGRYEGRIYQNNTRRYRSVYARSYEEAMEKIISLSEEDKFPAKSRALLLSSVLKEWLSTRIGIKSTSLSSYRSVIEKQIIPYYKRKTFGSLKPADLERFKMDKLSEGFSEGYVAKMVVIIKSAAEYASVMYNCTDPFRNVSLPKIHKKPAKLLSSEEQKVFVKACMKSGLSGLGCFLSLFLGLRIGEVCGLKWENIDLNAGTLSVRFNVQRVSDEHGRSKVIIQTPKTDTSIRDIPIPSFVIKLLRKHRQADNTFLISGSEKPVEPRTLTNHFKAILKKEGLPSVKFHSLRHSFATNFLRQSGDIKSLSEILGHANVNITLSIYVHSSMEQKMLCMEKMSALL